MYPYTHLYFGCIHPPNPTLLLSSLLVSLTLPSCPPLLSTNERKHVVFLCLAYFNIISLSSSLQMTWLRWMKFCFIYIPHFLYPCTFWWTVWLPWIVPQWTWVFCWVLMASSSYNGWTSVSTASWLWFFWIYTLGQYTGLYGSSVFRGSVRVI